MAAPDDSTLAPGSTDSADGFGLSGRENGCKNPGECRFDCNCDACDIAARRPPAMLATWIDEQTGPVVKS